MHLTGWKLWATRIGVLAAIVGAIVGIETARDGRSGAPPTPTGTAPSASGAAPEKLRASASLKGPAAPELRNIAAWINTEPLTLQALQGKVVLVDFWAYSCINCIRTMPYLRDWHEKYSSRGLVIVGLHAPEFDFERSAANVREAVVQQGITWPVGLDNDFATWSAYRNRYWPHKFLIDKDGAIRYDRIGEGGYEETERQIRRLLVEAGAKVDDIPLGGVTSRQALSPSKGASITRELYAGHGWAAGGYLGNADDIRFDQPAVFVESGKRESGRIYLHGTWQVGRESVQHAADTPGFGDYVGIRFTAASVNAVLRPLDVGAPALPRPPGSMPFRVLATIDGKAIPREMRGDDIALDEEGRTFFIVDEPRLYNVVRGPSVVTRDLELRVSSTGFVLYTFTFGS